MLCSNWQNYFQNYTISHKMQGILLLVCFGFFFPLFLFFILDENSSNVLSFAFNQNWPVMRILTLVYFYDNCVYIKVFNAEKQLSICSDVLFNWLESESFSFFVFNIFKKSSSLQTEG